MSSPRVLTPSEAFRERMEDVRRRLKLSQADLAEQMGVHQSTVARYEKGERAITLDDAIEICALLGQSPLHMFVPDETDRTATQTRAASKVEVVPSTIGPSGKQAKAVTASLGAYRSWLRGERPLDMGDVARWDVGRPMGDKDPTLRRIAEVAEMLFDLRDLVAVASADQLDARGQEDALALIETMKQLLNYERLQIERTHTRGTKQ